MQALARGIGRYCFGFVLFYWICFTFPFPLDLVGLPFQLVKPDYQPAWMKAAGEEYGKVYSWITSQKRDRPKSEVLSLTLLRSSRVGLGFRCGFGLG
jgi:hypothetical protein